MSDVVLAVMKYRGRLKSELDKVDGFLHMAEEFSKESDPEARLASTKTTANATAREQPAIELARRAPKEAAAG